MATATTSFSNWDFLNYHVQQEMIGGQFVSAESTLVAAGPPKLSSSDSSVYPVGLLETVGLQQNKQLQRIFEIGSSRSYFIPGRCIGSLTIGRTFYFGPSLLRVLYAYYSDDASLSNGEAFGVAGVPETLSIDGMDVPNPAAQLLTPPTGLHKLRRNPGSDYFFIDLASDLFSQPTGLAIYFKDMNYTSVGAMYLEDNYVQGHQMTISSGSVLVMEGASMQYDRIVPIKMIAA